MQNLDKLHTMLEMQKRLNDETNGIGWENGYTKEGKIISWKRCVYMECAELIDSFAWKHWKNITEPTNTENVAIEIVDIWHFVMSMVLEDQKFEKDISKMTTEISAISGFGDFCGEAYDINEYSIYEIINDAEILIHQTSGFMIEIHELLTNYFRLSLKCGVNLDILYKKYIGKNVLNKFRQDHGYKSGKYKKFWNEKEDNVVMSEILHAGILSEKEIYKALEKEYQKVK